ETLSVRLGRMLKETRLSSTTLREYSLDRPAFETWMLGQRNCGHRTVRELREAIATRMHVELATAEVFQSKSSARIEESLEMAPSHAPVNRLRPKVAAYGSDLIGT
uniref:hypothetical protein n=1 Tax=Pantanalinema rosaneae TaxID=1620701 RepID=UPI003D6F9359